VSMKGEESRTSLTRCEDRRMGVAIHPKECMIHDQGGKYTPYSPLNPSFRWADDRESDRKMSTG